MSKLLKIIFSLIGLCFTLAVALLLFVVTWDPNQNKDWIAEKFQEETGRELTLGGEIGITFYPWLGLSINDVTIADDPAFGDTPLFHVDSANIRLKLSSLLQGQYEIDTVRVYGASTHLVISETGVGNWEIFNTNNDEADPATSADSSSLSNIILGGVDIRDTSVHFEDRRQGQEYAVTGFTMTTGELIYGEPIDYSLSFNATSSQPQLGADAQLTGTVSYNSDGSRYDIRPLQLMATLSGPNIPSDASEINLSTGIALDLDSGTLVIDALNLNAPALQLAASVNGRDIQSDRPIFDIEMMLEGSDLSLPFVILEQNELAQRIAEIDSPGYRVDLNMSVDSGRGNLEVSNLVANLLGADIVGNFSATNLQTDTPVFRGSLNASGPDLPTLVEVMGQIQGGTSSAMAGYGRELSRVPDKAFVIDTTFDANIQQGTVVVSNLDVSLLGASLTGSLNAARINTDTPTMRGSLNAQGPDLPLMLQIIGQLQGGQESALNQYGRQLRNGVNNRAFTANTNFDVNLQQGDIQIPVLNASMLGFQLNGNIQGSGLQGNNGTINGSVNLSGDNLREVLAAIGQTELSEVTQRMALEVMINGTGNDIRLSPLNLDLVLSGPRIPNSPVTVTLTADTRLNTENETLMLENFSLRGLGLDLSGNINASDIYDARDFSGHIELASFNLRRLMQQLNQEVPVTADSSVLQTLALSTDFTGSSNHLNMSNIAMTLDESFISGRFSVTNPDLPVLDLALTVDRFNADRYLAPESPQAMPDTQTDTEIPVQAIRDLNLKAQLNVGELTFSNLRMNQASLSVTAADGVLTVSPSTNLYNGQFTGLINLNVSGEMPRAQIDTTLTDVTLGPLMQDYMNARFISGTGNIELAVNASGLDTGAMKRSLSGSGNVELEDGILQGVDISSVLRQIETMIRNGRLAQVQRGEQTGFDSFSSELSINTGVVTTNNLLIESPGFSISGRGTLIDLNNESLDFNLVTTVDEATATNASEEFDIGGYSLPLACTGSISSPRCLPDVQTLVQAALANAVRQGVTDFLQRAVEGGRQQQEQTSSEPQTQEEQEQSQQDPTEELINRALDRLFR